MSGWQEVFCKSSQMYSYKKKKKVLALAIKKCDYMIHCKELLWEDKHTTDAKMKFYQYELEESAFSKIGLKIASCDNNVSFSLVLHIYFIALTYTLYNMIQKLIFPMYAQSLTVTNVCQQKNGLNFSSVISVRYFQLLKSYQ